MAALLGALAAAPALAQGAASHPQTRDGFAISFGVGAGSAGFSCDGCSSDRGNGGSGYLRIGGAVRPNLVIAGELNGWTKQESGATGTIGYLTAVAQWYPAPASGFYLEGGIGGGSVQIDVTDLTTGTTERLESAGVAFQLGTGYDWRVARNFSLTPYVDFLTTAGGEAKYDGASLNERLDANVFQFGLGFSWH
jgi:hypothetical protein